MPYTATNIIVHRTDLNDLKLPGDLENEKIDILTICKIEEDENDTIAIAVFAQDNKVLLIKSGRMSFTSTPTGAAGVAKLKVWAESKNITRIERAYISREDYRNALESDELPAQVVKKISSKCKSDFETNFDSWRQTGK